jgi:hypothetical protein
LVRWERGTSFEISAIRVGLRTMFKPEVRAVPRRMCQTRIEPVKVKIPSPTATTRLPAVVISRSFLRSTKSAKVPPKSPKANRGIP